MKIIKAKKTNIKDVSFLFDLYRQFYKYKPNLKQSTKYIANRIKKNESTIFVCYSNKDAVGFVQLYKTFDSLNLNEKIVLYDLFVAKNYRKKGIGNLLMDKAKSFALKNEINLIELSTAVTNKKAQSLYEKLEYVRDKEYYNYYLEIKKK